jgi:hypothetical protein
VQRAQPEFVDEPFQLLERKGHVLVRTRRELDAEKKDKGKSGGREEKRAWCKSGMRTDGPISIG